MVRCLCLSGMTIHAGVLNNFIDNYAQSWDTLLSFVATVTIRKKCINYRISPLKTTNPHSSLNLQSENRRHIKAACVCLIL